MTKKIEEKYSKLELTILICTPMIVCAVIANLVGIMQIFAFGFAVTIALTLGMLIKRSVKM